MRPLLIADQNPKQQVQRQGQGPSYHKLIRNVNTKHGGENEAGTWHFRAEQTPEPGVQNLTSRAVTERPADDLDVAKFKQSDLFKFKRQYTLIGHRFIQGSVVIRMLRFHIPVDTFQNEDAIDAPPMSSDNLKLLDPSGNWILEVTTRVEDTSNGELTDKAKRELLNFQNLMDGAIDLYTPDRLALDTRVRNV